MTDILHLLAAVPLIVWIVALLAACLYILLILRNQKLAALAGVVGGLLIALLGAFRAGGKTQRSQDEKRDQDHAGNVLDRSDAARADAARVAADKLRDGSSPYQRD